MTIAILLIAHGSRHSEANADLRHVAESLRGRGAATIVEPSYLEFADPDIDGGGTKCVEQGARCVVLVPYFLSAGVHVRRDLTAARTRLALRFPQVEFRLAEPLGLEPRLLDIVEDRARQALAGLESNG